MIDNVIAIIPARKNSTRLKDKMMLDILGKPLIIRTAEAIEKCKNIKKIYIATDSNEIADICKLHKFSTIITSEECKTGSDRVYEALTKINDKCDYVINIQGDEPLINYNTIDKLIYSVIENKAECGTLVKKITKKDDYLNPNIVKAIKNSNSEAIYFSRSPIPYLRDTTFEEYIKIEKIYAHIGVYIYSKNILEYFIKQEKSFLEKAENLEQLRLIQNGKKIFCMECDDYTIGIDTEEDYKKLINHLKK